MSQLVLIIEYDEDIRSIYRATLAEHGYEVLTASQGAEGVHLARRHLPGLILMDM